MAGELVGGVFPEPCARGEFSAESVEPDAGEPGDPREPLTVWVETDGFSGKAIVLGELPAGLVLDMMVAPEAMQLMKMLVLFKLAVGDTGSNQVDIMSFMQLQFALTDWVNQSRAIAEGLALEE